MEKQFTELCGVLAPEQVKPEDKKMLQNKAMARKQIKSFIEDVVLAYLTNVYGTLLSDHVINLILEDICKRIDFSEDYNEKRVNKELQSWICNAIERKAHGL